VVSGPLQLVDKGSGANKKTNALLHTNLPTGTKPTEYSNAISCQRNWSHARENGVSKG
jgi:hypothetical protein